MNPYSPISWQYVYGFLGQNSKNWILRLLLDIWKSGSVWYRESLLLADFWGKGKTVRSKTASNEELFSTKSPKRGKNFSKVHFLANFSDLGPFLIHQIKAVCFAYSNLVELCRSLFIAKCCILLWNSIF